MSRGTFFFMGREIVFRPGETIAAALAAEGVMQLGADGLGQPTRYFCGIGACQGCVARVDGAARETCLTPAREGMQVESMEGGYV